MNDIIFFVVSLFIIWEFSNYDKYGSNNNIVSIEWKELSYLYPRRSSEAAQMHSKLTINFEWWSTNSLISMKYSKLWSFQILICLCIAPTWSNSSKAVSSASLTKLALRRTSLTWPKPHHPNPKPMDLSSTQWSITSSTNRDRITSLNQSLISSVSASKHSSKTTTIKAIFNL